MPSARPLPLHPVLLCAALAALLPACASQSLAAQHSREVARTRPAYVRVVAKQAAAQARPEGCRVEFAPQEPGVGQRMKKLADLELTGSKLDRAGAEKLLAAKACSLGAETLHISEEAYGSDEGRDRVEASAFVFSTPVQILPSGLEVEAAARPLDCRVLFFRTQRPDAAYDEIAGLQLNLQPEAAFVAPTSTRSQERALSELRQVACHLGADAIVISNEQYDVPTIGSRVSGTAILFRESRQRRPAPGAQEL